MRMGITEREPPKELVLLLLLLISQPFARVLSNLEGRRLFSLHLAVGFVGLIVICFLSYIITNYRFLHFPLFIIELKSGAWMCSLSFIISWKGKIPTVIL